MTLHTRLCLFLLGALPLVLIGFSATLYFVARTYLHRQVDERLDSALDTLAASAEIQPDGVEWEPQKRPMTLGHDKSSDQVRWSARDEEGQLVARSANLGADDFLAKLDVHELAGPRTHEGGLRNGGDWRVAQRSLSATTMTAVAHTVPAVQEKPDDNEKRYRVLVFTAGLCLEPVESLLRKLALVLSGITVGLWLVAAVLGGKFSRRALVPVARMAHSARSINASNMEERLPIASSGDELEDLGRAFNDLLARLQESFERQRSFTGDASHQLRTPLTAILGQIDVALRRDRSAEEYRQVLALVGEQAGHLHQLVEMLLFLARADAEARLPQLGSLDLSDWLTEHLRRWNGHARAADIRIDSPAGKPLPVRAQAPLLAQLIDNLLENACKYSEPGTAISLRIRADAENVFLVVEDAGRGISPEDLPHIFEPFYRSVEARKHGITGIGLGLAIAQRIARAFAGDVRVESQLGQGSRFTVRLPTAR